MSAKVASIALDTLAARSQPNSWCFEARTIDDAPELLEQSYALRYQVYCLERKFLNAENYPLKLEVDAFDPHSMHVAALDRRGTLAGTARAIRMSDAGLPLLAHCTLFPQEAARLGPDATPIEVGRLSVSRSYNRRAAERTSGCGDVFLTLLKALYQASKRAGATHWLAATERSLQRLLTRQGFPFRQIGPESDYFGLVAPYLMDLAEFDGIISSARFPMLQDFVVGLEPEFGPGLETQTLAVPSPHPQRDCVRLHQLGGGGSVVPVSSSDARR